MEKIKFTIENVIIPTNSGGVVFLDIRIEEIEITLKNFEVTMRDSTSEELKITVPTSWNPAREEEVPCISFNRISNECACFGVINEFFKKNRKLLEILKDGIDI